MAKRVLVVDDEKLIVKGIRFTSSFCPKMELPFISSLIMVITMETSTCMHT